MNVTRRTFLLGTAIAVSPVVLPMPAAAASPGSASRVTTWTSTTSANGWPLIPRPPAALVGGTGLTVQLAPLYPLEILRAALQRYQQEVGHLDEDPVLSWRSDPRIRDAVESNFLSGTAVAISPARYPLGASGNMSRAGRDVLHQIAAESEGVIRWGGDEGPIRAEGWLWIGVPPRDPRLQPNGQRSLTHPGVRFARVPTRD